MLNIVLTNVRSIFDGEIALQNREIERELGLGGVTYERREKMKYSENAPIRLQKLLEIYAAGWFHDHISAGHGDHLMWISAASFRRFRSNQKAIMMFTPVRQLTDY